MATTATITPNQGSAPVTLQAGNYSAVDDRRFWGASVREGVLSGGSYQVIQRAAGANMTVDVASSTGDGAVVTGDSVTAQGKYMVPPTAANVNVDIAAADATNPRNDLVVLEVKDDQHDAGGLNLARVRVITGTPNASAALTDAPGANGTPALPSSCLLLAVIRVAAGATSIATAAISDRRGLVSNYSLLGFHSLTTAFTTSATHTTYQDEGLTKSITYASNRVLRVEVGSHWSTPGGVNDIFVQVLRGSTQVVEWYVERSSLSTVSPNFIALSTILNGPVSGATETFKVQIKGVGNSSVTSGNVSTGRARFLSIEDLGPQ